MKKVFLLILICFSSFTAMAQLDTVTVNDILLVGNKKTKPKTILRELSFAVGEKINKEDLSEKLNESKLLLLNTNLFTQVDIYFSNWIGETNEVDITVQVVETWYIFPLPLFELADRNFNVWWVDQKRSLERTNYGVHFTHVNTTGRRDKLDLIAKFGYTKFLALSYEQPFINNAQNIGLDFDISFRQYREINYATVENKQAFYKNEDEFGLQLFNVTLGFDYRPFIRTTHRFSIGFDQHYISRHVFTELNPNFFEFPINTQRYFYLEYSLSQDYRDYKYYPLNGYYLEGKLEKAGLGLFNERSGFDLRLRYDKYYQLNKKFSVALLNRAKYSFIRNQQPYIANRAIGYNKDELRGYEYYVIDGLDMIYTKMSLRFEIINRTVKFGKIVPMEAFRLMPLRVMLSINNDLGYVNGPFARDQNPFNNRLLWGRGIGLDFVVYYNKVFSFEYSFNHLNEGGLFLHLNLNI
ncbi:MAG: POTRA domain-containing protein [Bacteroidota bacterium]